MNARAGRGWAYTGAVLGGAVSIAANVAHSYVPPASALVDWRPQSGAVIGAVFWPVALFVAVEILARTAWPAGCRWVVLRYLGLLPVSAVAAVVSYRHLAGLLRFYGEDPLTAMIGPLAVDGLMVMATGALIATGRRAAVAATATELVPTAAVEAVPTAEPAPVELVLPTPAGHTTPRRRAGKSDTAARVARLRQRHPDMSPTEIAKRLGVTDRTIRRHLNASPRTAAPAVA